MVTKNKKQQESIEDSHYEKITDDVYIKMSGKGSKIDWEKRFTQLIYLILALCVLAYF